MNAKERFSKACRGEEVDRPPVWMMRQAGRYLPEYRAIKEKSKTLTMMQTPEVACEITLQPVSLVGVDAAIVYSDILMIPDALGMGLDFVAGEGPRFEFALQSEADLDRLNPQDLMSRLSYVFETVALCCSKVPSDYPVLGFAGAPFTVACYMIAGGSKKDFGAVKAWAWSNPELYARLMDILVESTVSYLKKQIDAGATAVQLFDTWAGLLSPEDYDALAGQYSQKIFAALNADGALTMHYVKAGGHLLPQLSKMPSNVLSVDWRVSLKEAQKIKAPEQSLQGNLDPDFLLTTPEAIRARVKTMLGELDNPKRGYIANLGHGIGQFTPVENAKAFIQAVKEYGQG